MVGAAVSWLFVLLFVGQTAGTDNVNYGWDENPGFGYAYYIKFKFGDEMWNETGMKEYIYNGAQEWNNQQRQLRFALEQSNPDYEILITYENLAWPNEDALAIAWWWYVGQPPRISSGSIA